jgi:hypothetical protein
MNPAIYSGHLNTSDDKNDHGLYEIISFDAWHRYSTLRK